MVNAPVGFFLIANQWVSELRPVVWSERGGGTRSLSLGIHIRFCGLRKPQLTESHTLQASQAQMLSRSYNARLLVNIEINVKRTDTKTGEVTLHQADIPELCIGEIPHRIQTYVFDSSLGSRGIGGVSFTVSSWLGVAFRTRSVLL